MSDNLDFGVLECQPPFSKDEEYQVAIFENSSGEKESFFSIGRPLNANIHLLKFTCPSKLISDYVYNNKDWPIASSRLAKLIQLLEKDVELYPVVIVDQNTRKVHTHFFVINFTRCLDCIDRKKSEVTIHPLYPNLISSINKLVLNQGKIGNAKIFRLGEKPSLLVAHKSVKENIDSLGVSGINWIPIQNYRRA